MGCSPDPRSIDEGLKWFLTHLASGSGMCAQHTWHSLGGDRGCPPAWGADNANEVYDKVIASGRYWRKPRRGDIALYKYGKNGHAARVYNEAATQIATTNPTGNPHAGRGTGVEPIDYPKKWGASMANVIFTDTYNGIKCFESGDDMTYFHDVTVKPTSVLNVTKAQLYVPLDVKCKPATFSGAEFHMLYANCKILWDTGSEDDGVIRVKYVRDAFSGQPIDETGYQDYSVPKGAALGDPDAFLITSTHWEAGEKGRGGRWYIRCGGAIKALQIGTRYAKIIVVS